MKARWFGFCLLVVVSWSLSGCGGEQSKLSVSDRTEISSISAGNTPFIAFIELDEIAIDGIASISFAVQPKAGTLSSAVSANYSAAYLSREGYSFSGTQLVRLPIFGLYANYTNFVDITLKFNDGSKRLLTTVSVPTAAYTGSSSYYETPIIHVARAINDKLGFSYFYIKNVFGTPIIVDTDGNIRWIGSGSVFSFSSAWYQNGFVVGAVGSAITHYELDGRNSISYLSNPNYIEFHHNIDFGPIGLLGEFNQASNIESTIAEFDSTSGTVIKEWDLEKIITEYMNSYGDDASLFVRPGVDWFHNNAATYDSSDNSLIISSRENFLIKIDYASGRIIWIFGDPTKYWYTFPSLRAKALTLTNGGLYPIGQHAVSITPQGYLQVFNDGFPSLNQPALQGSWRSYSTVSAYSINEVDQTATNVSEFDNGKSILSNFCSSAYTEADGSMLIDYSLAEPGSAIPSATPPAFTIADKSRLVGVNPDKSIAFDFEYPANGCGALFAANVVRLESLTFN